MNDDVTITALLHKYGALAFWDYAAAAPYVKIDMNPQVIKFSQVETVNATYVNFTNIF
jgi:selenocysteine lyase/cysteine desulfurase